MASTNPNSEEDKFNQLAFDNSEEWKREQINFYSSFIFLSIEIKRPLSTVHKMIKEHGYKKSYPTFMRDVKKLLEEKDKTVKNAVTVENVLALESKLKLKKVVPVENNRHPIGKSAQLKSTEYEMLRKIYEQMDEV
jgi:hypothetical protein